MIPDFYWRISWILKIAMVILAARRRSEFYWYLIILIAPYGEIVFLGYLALEHFGVFRSRSIPGARKPKLAQLRQQYQLSPSYDAKVQLAEGLLAHGKAAEAETLFTEIVSSDAEDLRGLHGLARCEMRGGRPADASPRLRKIIETEEGFHDFEPWVDLTEALWASGARDDALAMARQLVELRPRINHQVLLGRHLKEMGEAGEARSVLERALSDFEMAPAFFKKTGQHWAREARQLLRGLG